MKKTMIKFLQRMMLGGVGVSMLIACSAESVNDEGKILNATGTTSATQELTMNDLVGRWNMYAMTSVPLEEGVEATAVDFDQNGVFTYDLLEET
ncbi:hypothetical protein, partial [Tamlana crocina]